MAEADFGRKVRPSAEGVRRADMSAARGSVYEAERSGRSELAKAHSRIGEAVAYCGRMLLAYDQHRLKTEYNADMNMARVIYADEFAKVKREQEQQTFSSAGAHEAWLRHRSARAVEQAKRRILEGDPDNGGFRFRNAERWEDELNLLADVNEATFRVKSTELYLAQRERDTMRTHDAWLSTLAQIGGMEELNAWKKGIDESELSDADREIYGRKYALTKNKILSREAQEDIDVRTQIFGADFERAKGEIDANADYSALKQEAFENAGEGGIFTAEQVEKNRRTALHNRALIYESDKKREQAAEVEMWRRTNAMKENALKSYSEKIGGVSELSDAQKRELLEKMKASLESEAQKRLDAFRRARKAEHADYGGRLVSAVQQAFVGGYGFEGLTQAIPTWGTDDSLLDPTNAETSVFRFLPAPQVGEAGYTEISRRSRTNAVAAISRLSKLNAKSETFASDAQRIMEDARLGGITKEDYASAFDVFARICAGENDNEKASYFEDKLFEAIRNAGMIPKEREKEIKSLEAFMRSDLSPDDADRWFLTEIKNATAYRDLASAQNYFGGVIASFTKGMQVRQLTELAVANLSLYASVGSGLSRAYDEGAAGAIEEERRKLLEGIEAERKKRKERASDGTTVPVYED